MSYLHSPRLTFSGDFLADVSTVNNDTQHYNNVTFKPEYQLPGTGSTNGWWNPDGGAIFNFQSCTVKKVVNGKGEEVTEQFSGRFVVGAEGRATGKMVDLDPDAQMYSQLWAVELRLLNDAGDELLRGKIDPVGFRDLQRRQMEAKPINGQPLGASWTSVLTELRWGQGWENSPFLVELKNTTHNNQLSIHMNVFGYYYSHEEGRFSMGRMIGTIGPWFKGEPITFAACRRLYGTQTKLQYSNFIIDEKNNQLVIDVGGSLPVYSSLGRVLTPELMFAIAKNTIKNAYYASPATALVKRDIFDVLKVVDIDDENWLMNTGGIITIDNISDYLQNAIDKNQLLVVSPIKNDDYELVARESIEGIYFRADESVQRLDNGDTHCVNFYAYQWGKPLAGKTINVAMQEPTSDTPQEKNSPQITETYGNNFPQDGLTFDKSVVTDANGKATIQLTGNAIHSPRHYIDGQIYFLSYNMDGWNDPAAPSTATDQVIVVHLRDAYNIPETPVWSDIRDTMVQFGNLYPIMSRYIVDLADPQAVIAKKDILKFAFSQDINSPLYMPVTRDLSENKRRTILAWLDNPIIDTDQTTSLNAPFLSPKTRELREVLLSDEARERREMTKQLQGFYK